MSLHFGRKLTVLLVGVAALALVVPASAQDTTTPTPNNTITVNGTGTAYAAPDVAYVELGVQTVDPDLATAFSKTGDAISKVLNALTDLGIAKEDIQTSGINVTPQNQYDNNGNLSGQPTYQVTNTVQVTVRNVDQVESVLTSAVEAGANTIYNLSFGIQDPSTLEQQARAQAVQQAQDRAQQLASALGVTLGSPLIVTEVPQNSGGPVPVFGRGVMMASAAGSSQPVNQGQLSVDVEVQITFSIG